MRDLVPADLWSGLGQARIAITNYHAFLPRERGIGKQASGLTKDILNQGRKSPFLETPAQIASRVLQDLGGGSQQVLVLNDEAHHCYRGRVETPEAGAETEGTLKGLDRTEAKERNEEARVWFTGLKAVNDKVGIKLSYDLSATPFFLSGSGYREGTLFPWVASDFSLIDAIESGLVKIPRVPVDDDRVVSRVTYLNLWHEVRDHLPRKSRKDVDLSGPPNPPKALEGALQSLYGSYVKSFEEWESDAAERGETPPVFIVVCSNTTVSKLVFDWIAGWERPLDNDTSVPVPGKLPLFSNVVDGTWTARPRTILVDSAQLESGEAMSAEFKAIAATEIEEFKREYRDRFPGRSVDDITDEDMLREVMNTVGKTGRLGEHVRCVVSVSMLTEGWDANTVTHILGVRAFGTQLLCEQVVGRGLRRRSYAVDDDGRFTPECADVYGVPFQFIPTVAPTKELTVKPTRRVHSDPARAHAEITFPRLVGYRVELPDAELFADLDGAPGFAVTKDSLPTYTLVSGVVGQQDVHRLEDLRQAREQSVAFEIARVLVERELSTQDDPKPWHFPQAVRIVREWMSSCVTYHDDTYPGLLLLTENTFHAAERVWDEVLRQVDSREPRVLPLLRPYDAEGSTAEVDFFTTREVYPTSEERCHVNYVVLDGQDGNAWERTMAQGLEALPGVESYVKNDHLGFTIPYTHEGRTHQFVPDFLVRLTDQTDGVVRTLVVEVSGGRKDQAMRAAKAAAARDLWVPAVNNDGRWGVWGFGEIDDPTRAKMDVGAAADALRRKVV